MCLDMVVADGNSPRGECQAVRVCLYSGRTHGLPVPTTDTPFPMPHDFLTDFLTKLQDAGELVRVAAPVDAALEVAAIVDQAA